MQEQPIIAVTNACTLILRTKNGQKNMRVMTRVIIQNGSKILNQNYMETTNKLTYLSTKFFTENKEEYRITVTVSLDDDCHNNMCDWSVTADIRQKNQYGTYGEYMGGCCHDEVAKHFPELAKFISLHLCNHYGAPMYPVENGIYHVRRSGMSVAMEYLRISEQECVELYKASEDKMYFKYLLFNLGIVDRWKRESDELLVELEKVYFDINGRGTFAY